VEESHRASRSSCQLGPVNRDTTLPNTRLFISEESDRILTADENLRTAAESRRTTTDKRRIVAESQRTAEFFVDCVRNSGEERQAGHQHFRQGADEHQHFCMLASESANKS